MLPCKCFIHRFFFLSWRTYYQELALNQMVYISENLHLLGGQQCQVKLTYRHFYVSPGKILIVIPKMSSLMLGPTWTKRHGNSNKEILRLSVQQWHWKDYDKDEQQQSHQLYHATILVMQPGNKNDLNILLEQQKSANELSLITTSFDGSKHPQCLLLTS